MPVNQFKALLFSSIFLPSLAMAGTTYVTDFEAGSVVPKISSSMPNAAGSATAEIAPVGTIDVQDSLTPSAAIQLTAHPLSDNHDWAAAAVVGPLSFKLDEADLRKITLSFMASVSTLQPVTVRIESLNPVGDVIGGASAEVYPAAPNFYQRYALDLSSFKTDAGKPFNPNAKSFRISFGISYEPGLPAQPAYELRVDNLAISTPSFYVSPKGNDSADGKTEKTALASPQKALDLAMPGDIILLKTGTYTAANNSFAFTRPGTPAGWIVLKNAPGETPVLRSQGWTVIGIGKGSSEALNHEPAIAYIEVRGIKTLGSNTVDANGKPVTPFPKLVGKVTPETNGSGISIDGRFSVAPVHHIRVADCVMEKNAGGGMGSGYADWLSFENNICIDNAWFTVYACSGISILEGQNFDGTKGGYRFLVSGNRSSGNRCYQMWTESETNDAPKHFSDGNGIIIDTLNKSENAPAFAIRPVNFSGRTLVVNNVSFNNGGSGIHLVSSPNVDLVNNTTYLNSASPELHYPQMFAYRSAGCNFVNNILVARPGEKTNNADPYAVLGDTNTVWSNNLFFGTVIKPAPGINDLPADPKFVKPTLDPTQADFTLRPDSPAVHAGTRKVPVPIPLVDIDGHRRPLDKKPSIGASQP